MKTKNAHEPWPSEVRYDVIKQHEKLSLFAERIEERLEKGPIDATARIALYEDVSTFTSWLLYHMEYEELHLFPLLEEADAWGGVRRCDYLNHHNEQRAEIEALRGMIRDERDITKEVHAFIAHLREEMALEEAQFLNPKLLRDDLVSIDAMGA